MNPWSALLNGGMLAQGRNGSNGEGRFHGSGSLRGAGGRIEDCFEVELAGFGEFKGAGELGAAGGFYKDGMGTGGEFQGGGGIAVEFAVDVDFGGVGFRSDCEQAVAVRCRRGDGR